MLQSNQINNENALPPIKNEAINSQGKIRILAFDVNFANKETVVDEDILLVKLPKTNCRILQIGLVVKEGTDTDTFSLILEDILYNNIKGGYSIVKSANLKTGIAFANGDSMVLYINKVVAPIETANVEKYIALKSSIDFTKDNLINGYVLYIAD
ncbi:MAG: hypothetical protein LBH40_04195 [Alphaproteobacteria bacterium]|jgi:hypothetical protein|nr:hypothetical protein [Alphaproteobacteria bacterium]